MYSLIILWLSARFHFVDVQSLYAGVLEEFLSTEHDEFVSTDFSVNGGYTQ